MRDAKYVDRLYRMLLERSMTDIEIICADGSVTCHAVILAVTHVWWTKLLQSADSDIVILPDVKLVEMERLLELVYTGEVNADIPRDSTHLLFPSLDAQLNLQIETLPSSRTLERPDQGKMIILPVEDPQMYPETVEGYTSPKLDHIDQEIPERKTKQRSEEDGEQHRDQLARLDLYGAGVAALTKDLTTIDESDCGITWDRHLELGINEEVVEMCETDAEITKVKTLKYECQLCFKSFNYPKDLRKHLLVHEDKNPFMCKLCKRPARNLSNMYQHLKTNHFIKANLKDHIVDEEGKPLVDKDKKIREQVSQGVIDKLLLSVSHVKRFGSVGVNSRGREVYRCLVCGKNVVYSSLRNHLKTHDQAQMKYRCEVCGKRYCTSSSLSYHCSTAHPSTPRFACVFCQSTFDSLTEKTNHQRVCPNKKWKIFPCKLCTRSFKCKTNLSAHVKSVHEGRAVNPFQTVECKVCGKRCAGKRKLFKHRFSCHGLGTACEVCGKEFTCANKLLCHTYRHRRKVHRRNCSRCSRRFTVSDAGQCRLCKVCRYVNVKTKDTETSVKSSGNGKTNDSVESNTTENVSVKYQCPKCNILCDTRDQLSQHKKMHKRSGKESEPLKCEHCSLENKEQYLPSPSLLRRHLRKHKCRTVMAPVCSTELRCSVCARNPATASKLNQHITTWINSKVFRCVSCDRSFSTQQALNVHVVVHTREKPFNCDLCGERFTQSSSLRTHMTRHEAGNLDPENLQCGECGKQCKNLAGYKRHLVLHSPARAKPVHQSRSSKQMISSGNRLPWTDLKSDQQSTVGPGRLSTEVESTKLSRSTGLPPTLKERQEIEPLLPERSVSMDKQVQGAPLLSDSALSGLLRLDGSNPSFLDQYQVTTINIEGLDEEVSYKTDGLSENPSMQAFITEDIEGVDGSSKAPVVPYILQDEGVRLSFKEGVSYEIKDAVAVSLPPKDPSLRDDGMSYSVAGVPVFSGREEAAFSADASYAGPRDVTPFLLNKPSEVNPMDSSLQEAGYSFYLPRSVDPAQKVGPVEYSQLQPDQPGRGRELTYMIEGEDQFIYKIEVIDEVNLKI